MPRVHHVKSARKQNPVCEQGESYYWWKFRYGGKHYSLTPPRQSQLTQSDFLSQAYGIGEDIEGWSYDSVEDIKSNIDSVVDEIRSLGSEQQDKFDNMPDGLQQGDTGQLLEERVNACEEWADNLENIDFSECEISDEDVDERIKEYPDYDTRSEEGKAKLRDEVRTELEQQHMPDIQGELEDYASYQGE